MQHLQTAGHPGLVRVRMEDRTARISQVVRVALKAIDMAFGVGLAREIGFDCEAYPYSALYPSSRGEAQPLSSSVVEPFSDIGSSV